MDDDPIMVMIPLVMRGTPAVPSNLVECDDCGTKCWLSKRAPQNSPHVCLYCGASIMARGKAA